MNIMLIHAVLFLAGGLALAGFACYICRGRPAISRRRARELRAIKEIEYHLLTQVKAPGSENSRDHDHEGFLVLSRLKAFITSEGYARGYPALGITH